MTRHAIAVDLGGTNVRAGLVRQDGKLEFYTSARTRQTGGPEAVLDQIEALVSEVRAHAADPEPIIGVSAPGPIDTRRGWVFATQSLSGVQDYPLRDELARRLGTGIALENDGIAGALGEWQFGAGRGLTDILYVTLSTGIGGGIIANGRPLRGLQGLAGHVGHTFFVADWQRYAGRTMPALEDYASGTALAYRARQEIARHPDSLLASECVIDPAAIIKAAGAGDAYALALVKDETWAVGLGLASLVHVLNPQMIVIGGGLAASLSVLLPGIVRAMNQNLKPGFDKTEIVPAALGQHSCLYGGAALALDPSLVLGAT